jgi:hypothetical protein
MCKPCSTHGDDKILLTKLARRFERGMGNLYKEYGILLKVKTSQNTLFKDVDGIRLALHISQ